MVTTDREVSGSESFLDQAGSFIGKIKHAPKPTLPDLSRSALAFHPCRPIRRASWAIKNAKEENGVGSTVLNLGILIHIDTQDLPRHRTFLRTPPRVFKRFEALKITCRDHGLNPVCVVGRIEIIPHVNLLLIVQENPAGQGRACNLGMQLA